MRAFYRSSVCFIPSCTGLLTAVLEDAHERLLQVLCLQCFEILIVYRS